MAIEKPISTIRKAVNSAAENMAKNEFLDKPEQRHYESVISEYKWLRAFEPEFLEKILVVGAKGSELKDEMGTELYNIFDKVRTEMTSNSEDQFKDAIEQIKMTKNLSLDELNQEISNLIIRYFKIKGEEIKNDPRIKSAFFGKEELLDKAINFIITSLVDINKILIKTPEVKVLNSLQEMFEKMQRVKRGKSTSKELKEMEVKGKK
ncbi:MAG: hypothetical protein WC264_00450 [Candidatus Paceibacterota bacterium]|jgi:hypothetical protein